MIREEYVNFETAKLLKQAGFPQFPLEPDGTQRGVPCTKCYTKDGLLTDWIFQRGDKKACSAPTQAQAMRWLREEKNLNVRVNYSSEYYSVLSQDWSFDVLNLDTGEYFDSDNESWNPYEAAAEAGIQAAAKYLIKEQKGGKV